MNKCYIKIVWVVVISSMIWIVGLKSTEYTLRRQAIEAGVAYFNQVTGDYEYIKEKR